jgi:aromatic ring-opening dioxygenase catalytic subunit (LigB family)
MTIATTRMPTLFIPHGGGPCFFMPNPPDHPKLWDKMGAYLRGIAKSLPEKPRAILVISGHWEENKVTVNASPAPSMLFDYYGFPPHTYQLKYPAPGSPELATEIRALLAKQGIESGSDPSRGYDHGVFVPFLLMFPDADIPVVQISLLSSLNPEAHLAVGRALAPLRDQGVLIVGSGMSYHNMGDFRMNTHMLDPASVQFDGWLTQTVSAEPTDREEKLAHWAEAPGARKSHPREEHLLPMMIAAGAADGDKGQRVFNDVVWGKVLSSFQFG